MGGRIFHHAGLSFCCRSRLSSNVRRQMIYTFAVLQNPLKAVPSPSPGNGHYFGGELGTSLGLVSPRFARILTLDLEDPLLGFLRFTGLRELPLLMDFERGCISYTVIENGTTGS